jgi:hypothetical protein
VQQPQDAINKKFRAMLLRKARIAKGHVGGIAELSEEHHAAMEEISRWHEQARTLGPVSRFGDGDGSWWDRWLVAPAPEASSFKTGYSCPQSGFKRSRPGRHHVGVPTRESDSDSQGIRKSRSRTWREAAGLEPDNSDKSTPAERSRAAMIARREREARDRAAAEERVRQRELARQGERIVFQFQTEQAKKRADVFAQMVERSTKRLVDEIHSGQ